MTKKVSKDEALKAVKTITKEISESSLEQEALEAVRTLILWAGDDPEREGLVDTPKRVVKAYKEFFAGYNEDPEEIVDGLIDICVFAIGTLDVFGVDANEAWNRIYEANMAKSPGVKEGRPNPFGLPDLIKPEGWESPNHEGNHGSLSDLF